MRVYKFIVCVFLFAHVSWSQTNETQKDSVFTPYELLTSYYNNNFKPFKKKSIYIGLGLSLEDRQLENTDILVETILDGDRTKFDLDFKGGYFIHDYAMVGLNINYFQNKFTGRTIKDGDSIQSNAISRGFAITPTFRSLVPLTANERLSFFTDIGLTFGGSSTVSRDVKNIDEIDKTYAKNFNFRAGISPGVIFFAMENFALEIQLDVLGYELNTSTKTTNGGDESKTIRQNIDFNIELLSLKLGLSYYL